MLKFVKQNLEQIEGVEVYPIISLMICFLFFTALFWWVLTAKKQHIDEVSQMPLDDAQPNIENK